MSAARIWHLDMCAAPGVCEAYSTCVISVAARVRKFALAAVRGDVRRQFLVLATCRILRLPSPLFRGSKADRLDWMYQGGLGQRQEADQRHAAQEAAAAASAAATQAPADTDAAQPGGAPAAPSLPAFYSEDTPASANEMWQRLHADPLFAIKQQVRPWGPRF